MKARRICLGLLIYLIVLAQWGCVTPRPPLYIHPNITEIRVETIALLPIVDRRSDRSKQLDLDKYIRYPAKEVLEKKGYHVLLPEAFVLDGSVDAADIAEMDENQLSSLVIDGADACVVVYLEDLRDEYLWRIWLTYIFDIKASVKIVSKGKGLLFSDKAEDARQDAGLIAAPMTKFLEAPGVTRGVWSICSLSFRRSVKIK